MVGRGLVASRSRAQDLIRRGLVTVDEVMADKTGQLVSPQQLLAVSAAQADYVSRGAEKLLAALDAFGLDPRDRITLDVGASTGGFTEILLARGAKRVHAVDVGRQQLHARLRADARVVVHEATDARTLSHALIPDPVDAIVADVSFISLVKAMPAALALAAPDCWLVVLVKPQFEVGRTGVGKGGIVRDVEAREQAVVATRFWLESNRWRVLGTIVSPISGGDGNQEYLIGAVRS